MYSNEGGVVFKLCRISFQGGGSLETLSLVDCSVTRGSRRVNWNGSEWGAKGEAMSENLSVGGTPADDCVDLLHCASMPDMESTAPREVVPGEPAAAEGDNDGVLFSSERRTSLFRKLRGSTSHRPGERVVLFSQSVSLSLSVSFL